MIKFNSIFKAEEEYMELLGKETVDDVKLDEEDETNKQNTEGNIILILNQSIDSLIFNNE